LFVVSHTGIAPQPHRKGNDMKNKSENIDDDLGPEYDLEDNIIIC
jgi:hypothetical protein